MEQEVETGVSIFGQVVADTSQAKEACLERRDEMRLPPVTDIMMITATAYTVGRLNYSGLMERTSPHQVYRDVVNVCGSDER
jgi:hypothetical protein